MRISDTIKLATTNLRQNKRRSITIVVTMAVIFSLVMGVEFFVRGTRDSLLKASIEQTDGRIFLDVGYISSGGYGNGEKVESFDEMTGRLAEAAERYGGKQIGMATIYDGVNGQYMVVDESVAGMLVEGELRAVPEGKIGVIVAQTKKGQAAELKLPKNATVVGEFRNSERRDLMIGGFSPTNLITGGIWNFGAPEYYLIDSAAAEKYAMNDQREAFEASKNYLLERQSTDEQEWQWLAYEEYPMMEMIVEFDEYEKAKEFYDAMWDDELGGLPETIKYEGLNYGLVVDDFVGNTMGIARDMDYTQNMIMAPVIVVLAVIALIVALSAFVHLVESDMATISLYRAMGASIWQVYAIYFIYLLELCLLAVGLSVVIGLVLAGVVSVISALNGFGVAVQEFFGLTKTPAVILIGIDGMFWKTIGLMLLIAPVTIVMASWRFSAKHVAKKLKEEA